MSESKTDRLAEIVVDTFNALEALAVNGKRQVAELMGVAEDLPGSEDLSKLPWKSYQTKQTAKGNEAAWVFSNIAGAEALLATLKAKDGKARIGNFDFQLQGAEKQFISRRPVKSK